jgi:hypothetical protein
MMFNFALGFLASIGFILIACAIGFGGNKK